MKSFKKFLDKPTYNINKLATKHKKSLTYMKSQLEAGIQVELEHSNSKSVAKEIALDHLAERPDYYEKLKKVEDN